jgi:hypothetical protein
MTSKVLAPYRGVDGRPKSNPLTPEEIKRIDENFQKWRKTWIDRQKVYKESVIRSFHKRESPFRPFPSILLYIHFSSSSGHLSLLPSTGTDPARLLGLLQDMGMLIDASFEEDQGINPNDEDAIEVLQGEFCRVTPVVYRRPTTASKNGSGGGLIVMKRSSTEGTVTVSASPEEVPKKKKAKKV